MDDNTTNVEINVDVNGTSSLRSAADAIGEVGDSLKQVARSLSDAIGGLDKVEKNLSGAGRQAKTAAKGVDDLNQSYKDLNSTIGHLKGMPAPGQFGSNVGGRTTVGGSTSGQDAGALLGVDNDRILATAAAHQAADRIDEQIAARQANRDRIADNASIHNRQQIQNVIDAKERLRLADEKITASNSAFNDGLNKSGRIMAHLVGNASTVRYALYDVSRSFAVVGVGLLAGSVAVAAAAITYERSFANVIRTANDGSISMEKLRGELIDLSEQIPISFSNLTEIATLGGQLGIVGKDIDEFTSVVARLAATTDLSAEAAGTALGRFQALLGVDGSEFEGLASAILKVGVNSVATESQIVAVSTQISSMADFAGFTADQVVGLAGALASVGAAPELSRGTITRTFTLMSKAVAEGGDTLIKFARIAGVSSAQFSQDFGTNRFAPIFQSFLAGLEGIESTGGNAVTVLNDLGIKSVRDVPLLLRLAGAQDTVTQAFSDAESGYRLATELQDQYGIISETTAARLEILINSVTNLMAELGNSANGPIKEFVDGIANIVQGITDFLATDVGQRVGLIALAITGLVGVISLLISGFTMVVATGIAVNQALVGLSLKLPVVVTEFTAADIAARRAALGMKVFTSALKILSVVGIALILPDVMNWARDGIDQIRGFSHEYDDVKERFKQPLGANGDILGVGQKSMADITDFLRTAPPGFEKLARSFGSGVGWGDIAKIDEDLAKLAAYSPANAKKELDGYQKQWLSLGGTQEQFNNVFLDTIRVLDETATSTGVATDEAVQLADAEQTAAEKAENVAARLNLTSDSLKELVTNLAAGSAEFFDFEEMLLDAYDEGHGGLSEFITMLDEQLVSLTGWQTNLATLVANGGTSIVEALAPLGPKGATAIKDAVDLMVSDPTAFAALDEKFRQAAVLSDEGFVSGLLEAAASTTPGAVDAYIKGWNQELAGDPLIPVADTEPAKKEIAGFLVGASGKRIPIYVDVVPGNNGVVIPSGPTTNWQLRPQLALAAGGYITGAGTATSDSIPALLSNREFVINAASTKGNEGILNYLNKYGRLPGFASGGSVGGSSSSAIPMSITELGPKSLGVLREGLRSDMQLYLDPMGIARLANKGNKQLANQGAQ